MEKRYEEIVHRADVLDIDDEPVRRSLCNVHSVDGLARKVINLFKVEYFAVRHLIGVKGGEKPDRRGGVKIDHFGRREGLICLDLQG
jgi:hypothetical protein